MKRGKSGAAEENQVFFDEVHRAEEEIDLFLTKNREEADRILEEAREQVKQQREQILRESQEETADEQKALISRAEEEAAGILAEASGRLEREKNILEEIRSSVTGKILDHLLMGTE